MKTCAILSAFAAVALALPLSIKLPLSIQPGGPILGTGLPAVPTYTATGVSNPPPETPVLPPFPTISGASTLTLPTIAYGTAVPGVATPTGFASAVIGPVLSLVTAAPSLVTPSPILGALQSDIVAGSTLSLLGLTASIVLQPDLV
ncbi:hypothetical protein Tdes44962_MAKER06408 [Teratosphaeria destructans]|uniref:Uncharacterized protein n=1 Tax=Teratosphaeria destructans TaxID=418781 RepID=A0A9W7T2M0_9PEZI|nr:hypothetical protein Tdes44962_MAKER06408 [Teratosphaeria destructans]